MKIDGVNSAWKKPNKKSYFFLNMQPTNVDENTNVQNVGKLPGYKVEDHLLKVFID